VPLFGVPRFGAFCEKASRAAASTIAPAQHDARNR
jgi:hypothetical protein